MTDFNSIEQIPGAARVSLPESGAGIVAINACFATVRLQSGVRPANICVTAGYFNRTGIDVEFQGEGVYDGLPADPSIDFSKRDYPYYASFNYREAIASRGIKVGGI